MADEDFDEGNRSIIMEIIGQLRKGTDLHRVTLPTFILEARSMCERLSDFFTYQDILFQYYIDLTQMRQYIITAGEDPSGGWHIRPKGVKKPFNPILGEFYRCSWTEDDGSEAFYICEQVSHHPPMSAFFYGNPQKGIAISGELIPQAKFFGNSAATIMEGGSVIYLPNDEYSGFFGGSDRDCIAGKITKKSTGETVYKICGKWTGKTTATDNKGKESLLFDATQAPKIRPRNLHPEMEDFESSKLWKHVAAAVKDNDHTTATQEKQKIEENQRTLVKTRKEEWVSRFFHKKNDKWELIMLDSLVNKPQEPTALRDFIFSKPKMPVHETHMYSPTNTQYQFVAYNPHEKKRQRQFQQANIQSNQVNYYPQQYSQSSPTLSYVSNQSYMSQPEEFRLEDFINCDDIEFGLPSFKIVTPLLKPQLKNSFA
ncbi:hypothetical protein HDV01_005943 [Terramyces sp. JEL0728]|nr:hypothetical protein HDV01_005943 [Terramyces sp. JEL0728]